MTTTQLETNISLYEFILSPFLILTIEPILNNYIIKIFFYENYVIKYYNGGLYFVFFKKYRI